MSAFKKTVFGNELSTHMKSPQNLLRCCNMGSGRKVQNSNFPSLFENQERYERFGHPIFNFILNYHFDEKNATNYLKYQERYPGNKTKSGHPVQSKNYNNRLVLYF